MRLLTILISLFGTFTLSFSQSKWIKIDNPTSTFVFTSSLRPSDHYYRMPTMATRPTIEEHPGAFSIIDFYVHEDCRRFKIRAVYTDASCFDTSDLSNYYVVEQIQSALPDSAKDRIIIVPYQTNQTALIDTNDKRYLFKKVGDTLYAFKYFWEPHNSNKLLLKRVSGAIYVYQNKVLVERGYQQLFLPYLTVWSTGDSPKKPVEPVYTVENLQYYQPGDTFEVYGTMSGQGISIDKKMLIINGQKLLYFDKILNALVIAKSEEVYNKKLKYWELPIYGELKYAQELSLTTFNFASMADSLPTLVCNDSLVKVNLVQDGNHLYGLKIKVLPQKDNDRLVTVKMTTQNGSVVNYLINLRFNPETL